MSDFLSHYDGTLTSIVSGQWGRGHWGQTGVGTQGDTLIPRQVSLEGQSVVQASAGARHTVALTANGKVFGWGDGEQGQLGMSNRWVTL